MRVLILLLVIICNALPCISARTVTIETIKVKKLQLIPSNLNDEWVRNSDYNNSICPNPIHTCPCEYRACIEPTGYESGEYLQFQTNNPWEKIRIYRAVDFPAEGNGTLSFYLSAYSYTEEYRIGGGIRSKSWSSIAACNSKFDFRIVIGNRTYFEFNNDHDFGQQRLVRYTIPFEEEVGKRTINIVLTRKSDPIPLDWGWKTADCNVLISMADITLDYEYLIYNKETCDCTTIS